MTNLSLAQYRFDQWTADTGLPQNSVYAIKQTRDGYIWLATVDGLARFDGTRFTIFNKSNSPGIVNNRFISLFEQRNGNLWAGTEESGVVRLRNGLFSSFGVEYGLRKDIAFFGTGDEEGNPTITYPLDLKKVHFDGEKFSPYEPGFETEKSGGEKKIKVIHCSLNYPENYFECQLPGKLVRIKSIVARGATEIQTSKSVEDKNGSIWMPFSTAGLLKYDPDGKTTVYRAGETLPGNPLFLVPREDGFSLLSKDKEGAIWLTELPEMKSELVSRHPPESFFEFTQAYQDSEGSIWLGTLRSGLFRLRRQTIRTYSTPDETPNDNNIYPIYQDRQGTIWVGALGLFKYENNRFEIVKGSEKLGIQAIGETPDGRLLVGVYEPTTSELIRASRVDVLEQNQLKTFYPHSIPLIGITTAIYSDEEGAVWLGGLYGLKRLKDGAETDFIEQLAGKDVKVIISDGDSGMWIGSYGGLTHYKNGQFQKWTESEGLPNPNIRALYLDSDGALWIGSYDSGLARFKDGKFTHYNTKNGLYNDGAFQILEDEQRNFWLSSNRGIYRVSKDELNELAEGKRNTITSIAYGKSDGMLNVECNGGRSPGGIKAGDGNLWFPTQDGVAVVNPREVKANLKAPPVIIEEFKIDDKTISPEMIDSAIRNSNFIINIEPSQQSFEVRYTALSFINAENMRFKYQLEGLDNEWIDAGTRRTAYFSHIPPGSYTFRVIAANADGVWNETGAGIKITVLPPFYRTWWFSVLAVLIVMSVAYLLYKRRIDQLERQRLAQQTFTRQMIASQEAERKRIAAELHDSLGQRLVVIKNLALMFLNSKKGEEVTQIEELSDEASEAIGEVKEISYNLRPYQLDRIGLTKAIEAIIRSAQTASEIDFTAEIDNIDDYFPKDSEINFYRIVQECVNNIIKHSAAQNAEVKITLTGNILDLTISDDGHGFSSEGNLSNPQSQIPNPKSGGFGLIGITERAELLGGKVEIRSTPEQGTVIRILIKGD